MKKNINLQVLLVLIIFLFQGCSLWQPEYKIMQRKPAGHSSTRPLISVNFPLDIIQDELEKLFDSNEYLESLDRFDLDPAQKLLIIEGRFNYSLTDLFSLSDKDGLSENIEEHHFELSLSFPSTEKLRRTNFVSFKIHRLKINGDDYLGAYGLMNNFVAMMLQQSEMMKFILDKEELSSTLPNSAKDILTNKEVVIFPGTNTISVKLNFSNFDIFKRYASIKDFHLWHLSPFILEGTDLAMLRIEAGLGKAPKEWVEEVESQRTQNSDQLISQREELYEEYSQIHQVTDDLNEILNRELKERGIDCDELFPSLVNDLAHFQFNMADKARSRLNLRNALFKADPYKEYQNFIKEASVNIEYMVTDVQRRQRVFQKRWFGYDNADKDKPILIQRISQSLINTGLQYVRDMDFGDWQLFKKVNAFLSPEVPGIIFKGNLHINVEQMLSILGEQFSSEQLEKVQKNASDVDFELVLRLYMLPDGWLGVDIKHLALGSDGNQMLVTNQSRNGKFLYDFAKIFTAQILAPMSYQMSEEVEEDREQNLKESNKKNVHNEIYKNLSNVNSIISNLSKHANDPEKLSKAMKFDIDNNPFATAGEDYVEHKNDILFGDYIKFDADLGLIKMKIDPRLASETIVASDNTLQMWNLQPVFLEQFNNNFLELAVGDGPRSDKYSKTLRDATAKQLEDGYAGIFNDYNRNRTDLLTTVKINYLQEYINQILQDTAELENVAIAKEMDKDKQQQHYKIHEFRMEIIDQDNLRLYLTLESVTKSKRKIRLWRDKWKTDSTIVKVVSTLKMKPRHLNDIEVDKEEVLWSPYFIGLDIIDADIEFGDPSFFQKMANTILGKSKIQQGILNTVKNLMVKIVSNRFDDVNSNEDKKLKGNTLNEYVKLLSNHKDGILLQLNPRSFSNAFDVNFFPVGRYDSQNLSYIVDKNKNEFQIGFDVTPGIVNFDKKEIYNIINENIAIWKPYLKASDSTQLHNLLKDHALASKVIFNNDDNKKSLYNRFLNVVSSYPQLLNVVHIDRNSDDEIKPSFVTGLEMMYVAAGAYGFLYHLDMFFEQLEKLAYTEDFAYRSSFFELRQKVRNNIFMPLIEHYEHNLHHNNGLVLKQGPTFWNYRFYPDCVMAENIYKYLKHRLR